MELREVEAVELVPLGHRRKSIGGAVELREEALKRPRLPWGGRKSIGGAVELRDCMPYPFRTDLARGARVSEVLWGSEYVRRDWEQASERRRKSIGGAVGLRDDAPPVWAMRSHRRKSIGGAVGLRGFQLDDVRAVALQGARASEVLWSSENASPPPSTSTVAMAQGHRGCRGASRRRRRMGRCT